MQVEIRIERGEEDRKGDLERRVKERESERDGNKVRK